MYHCYKKMYDICNSLIHCILQKAIMAQKKVTRKR